VDIPSARGKGVMSFSKQTWDQLKNKTAKDLMSALGKDGAVLDMTRGAVQVFLYPDGRRVTIHYHPSKTYGPNLLKSLIEDIGWTEKDLRRLKLIK
jgi:predicted RNA binding protein YcfA (HicA-like mRNA interferase family)